MTNMENNKNLIAKDINWLQSLRDESAKNFAMPSKKDEYWKYDDIKKISKNYQYATQQQSDFDVELAGYKVFFENGYFVPQKSNLPDGVEVLPLIEAIILERCQNYIKTTTNKNPFVILNNANLQEGVFIHISKNINLKKPIAIINYSSQNNTWHTTKNIIVVDNNSSAEVLEYFVGTNNYFANVVNEFYLNQGATLNHYKINTNTSSTFTNIIVDVKKDATYNCHCLDKNTSYAKNEFKINLLEQGANAEVNAIYKTIDNNIINNTVLVSHLAANTTSNQLVKGVVNNTSSGIYQGKISIQKNCDNVVGNQQHRAIQLSDSAQINAKPELEIFNDDVKCSHGSAIGKLDENALFYLQARGINKEDAKSLLIEAFLKEVTEKIQNLDIKELFLLAI